MTTSLRDLKKAATARELAATAFRLVGERGYDDVTIDQIAEHAGYSRRTFANHFGGKAEAVVDGFLQRLQPQPLDDASVPRTFANLVDASEDFLVALLDGPALDDVRDFAAIAREHPALESVAHARLQAFRGSPTIAALAGRFGATRTMLYLSALVGLLGGSIHVVAEETGATCVPSAQPSGPDAAFAGEPRAEAPAVPGHAGGPPLAPLPDLTPELRARLRALVAEAFGYLRHGFVPGPGDASSPGTGDASPAP